MLFKKWRNLYEEDSYSTTLAFYVLHQLYFAGGQNSYQKIPERGLKKLAQNGQGGDLGPLLLGGKKKGRFSQKDYFLVRPKSTILGWELHYFTQRAKG